MIYVEKRTITRELIRALCVEKNWYTCGTNEEYEYLMKFDRIENLSTKDIIEMAKNIKEHSITDYGITSIAFELNRACVTIFER